LHVLDEALGERKQEDKRHIGTENGVSDKPKFIFIPRSYPSVKNSKNPIKEYGKDQCNLNMSQRFFRIFLLEGLLQVFLKGEC
jgi:hypothetical protein